MRTLSFSVTGMVHCAFLLSPCHTAIQMIYPTTAESSDQLATSETRRALLETQSHGRRSSLSYGPNQLGTEARTAVGRVLAEPGGLNVELSCWLPPGSCHREYAANLHGRLFSAISVFSQNSIRLTREVSQSILISKR
jgi:hypothetical protein